MTHRPALTAPRAVLWLLFGAVAIFLAHAILLNCVAEDAFITFRYARHLAEGHGLVWNIGERPVEGYTNFLWLLLCAAILKLGWDLPLVSQALGVLAGLGTMAYTFAFARRVLGLSGVAAALPCLWLAVSGPFAAWATSGMETGLFGLLVLAGCYHFAAAWPSGRRAQLLASALALLLATLTRPEGALVFGVLGLLGLLICRGGIGRALQVFAGPLLLYGIPFAAYVLWRYQYFGYWLPNTFYAKTGGTYHQYVRGAKYAALFLALFILPLVPLAAMRWRLRGRSTGRGGTSWRARIAGQAGLATCVAVSAAYVLYVVSVGGDYMAMFRFFVPILPLVYLLFGAAAAQRIVWGLVAVSLALTAVWSTPLEKRLLPKPAFMHGCYRGIQFERWASARFQLIGKFFRDYKQHPGESLGLYSIGAISYYADMPVYSVYGLVDPSIAHKTTTLTGKAVGEAFPGHEKADLPYVLSKRPTYMMFAKRLTKQPRPFPDNLDAIDPALRADYRPVAVWLDDAINGEQGYFSFLELKSTRP